MATREENITSFKHKNPATISWMRKNEMFGEICAIKLIYRAAKTRPTGINDYLCDSFEYKWISIYLEMEKKLLERRKESQRACSSTWQYGIEKILRKSQWSEQDVNLIRFSKHAHGIALRTMGSIDMASNVSGYGQTYPIYWIVNRQWCLKYGKRCLADMTVILHYDSIVGWKELLHIRLKPRWFALDSTAKFTKNWNYSELMMNRIFVNYGFILFENI